MMTTTRDTRQPSARRNLSVTVIATAILLASLSQFVHAGSGYRPIGRDVDAALTDRETSRDDSRRAHNRYAPSRRPSDEYSKDRDNNWSDSRESDDRSPLPRARRRQRDFSDGDGDSFGLGRQEVADPQSRPGRAWRDWPDREFQPARVRKRVPIDDYQAQPDDAWRGQLPPTQDLISRRYRDPAVLSFLNSVSPDESLAMYAETLDRIAQRHLAPPAPEQLVRRGMYNLVESLRNRDFIAVNRLPLSDGLWQQFADLLVQQHQQSQLATNADAVAVLQSTMQLAQQVLGLSPAVVALEFEYGAIESLDQFSAFVPPQRGRNNSAALDSTTSGLNSRTITIAQMLDPATAYLKLDSFGSSSAAEMQQSLDSLAPQGMRSVIIDLRGNPGGLLTSAIDIARLFLRQGTIVSTRGRHNDDNSSETATASRVWNLPLVLLVDEQSASASEILAAAIQENGRGAVVGRHTYGKGTVQTLFPLQATGASIRLTTAKFFSPTGRQMAGAGVEPDVAVETNMPGSGPDEMIAAALAVVRGNPGESAVRRNPATSGRVPRNGDRHLSLR